MVTQQNIFCVTSHSRFFLRSPPRTPSYFSSFLGYEWVCNFDRVSSLSVTTSSRNRGKRHRDLFSAQISDIQQAGVGGKLSSGKALHDSDYWQSQWLMAVYLCGFKRSDPLITWSGYFCFYRFIAFYLFSIGGKCLKKKLFTQNVFIYPAKLPQRAGLGSFQNGLNSQKEKENSSSPVFCTWDQLLRSGKLTRRWPCWGWQVSNDKLPAACFPDAAAGDALSSFGDVCRCEQNRTSPAITLTQFTPSTSTTFCAFAISDGTVNKRLGRQALLHGLVWNQLYLLRVCGRSRLDANLPCWHVCSKTSKNLRANLERALWKVIRKAIEVRMKAK